MQGSRPARRVVIPARKRQAGLSLVEVLVTLSITALASMLIVATARPSDPLKSEQAKLVQVLERLELRARVSGVPAGLAFERNSYAPALWREDGWQIAERERRTLPGKMILRVDPKRSGEPQVQFDPLMPTALPVIYLGQGGRELAVAFPREASS